MKNKVSLYIPCFNAAKTIASCIEAALKQTYPLEEIIVVDDGSTDESPGIAARYPVKLLSHNGNLGLARARNAAVKNARGDFIASLDADCCPQSNWLKLLVQKLSLPEIAGAGGRLLETNSKTVFDEWRSVRMRQDWGGVDAAPNFLFGSNTVFRKEALLRIGLYDERYKSNYEDVDICRRLREKGHTFVYEPKALVRHLRNDDVFSVLNTYWRWNIDYYQEEGHYTDVDNFTYKIKDNIGLANRYMEEDIAAGRYDLLYLDFILSLHHSLRDFEYFIAPDNGIKPGNQDNPALCLWLSLLDLTFFHHFGQTKNNLSTFISKENSFTQNFLALSLILGGVIHEKFRSNKFQKIVYKHLYISLYNVDNPYLLNNFLNLIESRQDWIKLIKKSHANLSVLFLESLTLNFRFWLEKLVGCHSGIIQLLKVSAENTEASLAGKEKDGGEDERR